MTDGNRTYCGDHFEMYRNTNSSFCVTGTTVVLQVSYVLEANKLIAKEIIFVVIRSEVWREGKLDEVSQKAQTSNYKIKKY